VFWLAVLYLLVAVVLLWIALNNSHANDLTLTTRILLGATSVWLTASATFALMRLPWARKMCIAVHVLVIVYGGGSQLVSMVHAPSVDPSDVKRLIVGALAQVAFIGALCKRDVREWFDWRSTDESIPQPLPDAR
jgi:hypothetical protein